MKRILVVIIILCIGAATGVFVIRSTHPLTENVPSHPASSPTSTVLPLKTITINNQTYAYDIIKTKGKSVFLIPNFNEKMSAQSIIDKYQCVHAVNGGFYDTGNNPLGFFVSDSYTHKQITSALLNGFFIISRDNIPYIYNSLDTNNVRIGLQSGPLLILDSHILPLRIQNDEHARRIVAAVTSDNSIVFIVFYSSELSFDGPVLAELPQYVNALSVKESLGFTNAINLDGGSASAFYSDSLKLSELTSVGSLFCIK